MRARDISKRAIIAIGVMAFSCGGDTTHGRLFSQGPRDGGADKPTGSGGSTPDTGCTKDTDCKGDRVCENGMCVAPSGGGAGGASTNPPGSGGVAPSSGGSRADAGTGSGGGGGRATGGMTRGGTSAGGAESGGSASGGAAAGGTGNGGKPVMCAVGQKPCQAKCVYPTPAVGCSLDSCTACTAAVPAHAYAICVNSQCGWECTAGYTRTAAGCVATGAGGFGGFVGVGGNTSGGRGGTGTGGKSESCNAASDCHNTCNVSGPYPCCTSSGTCGCTWTPATGICI